MKSMILAIGLATALPLHAAEVISQSPDNTAGYSAGGITGLMVGAALGGPLGALAGAAIGAFGGAAVQEATGHSEQAYRVRREDGTTERFRSPMASFQPGDQVQVQGIRLAPAH